MVRFNIGANKSLLKRIARNECSSGKLKITQGKLYQGTWTLTRLFKLPSSRLCSGFGVSGDSDGR